MLTEKSSKPPLVIDDCQSVLVSIDRLGFPPHISERIAATEIALSALCINFKAGGQRLQDI